MLVLVEVQPSKAEAFEPLDIFEVCDTDAALKEATTLYQGKLQYTRVRRVGEGVLVELLKKGFGLCLGDEGICNHKMDRPHLIRPT